MVSARVSDFAYFWGTYADCVLRECLCVAQVANRCKFAAIGHFAIDHFGLIG